MFKNISTNGKFLPLGIFIKSRSSRLLNLPLNRLDELFIKLWMLEGAVTEKEASITIWHFIANDQSNRLTKFQ